ncbi:MAG: TolC family protein, partial [Longimicrobiales bacterium]
MRPVAARLVTLSVVLLIAPAARPVAAQDSLALSDAYAAAEAHDPRAAEYVLLERSLSLQLENLNAEWLPRLSLSGEATRQSDVPSFQIPVPGVSPPRPPKDRYRAMLDVDQLLYEGGALSARRGVARAEVERERAELATRLYELRAEVDAAYFGSLALREQETELELLVTDLEARLAEGRAQVAAGALLPGEAAALEAELLAARQRGLELTARRRAAVAVLADLTDLALAADVRLTLPSL